jgi:hypothetical protein
VGIGKLFSKEEGKFDEDESTEKMGEMDLLGSTDCDASGWVYGSESSSANLRGP